MSKNIGIIISSMHPAFENEYKIPLSKLGFNVNKYVMEFVPGHGFKNSEKELIKNHMEKASKELNHCDAILYVRSYGSFYEEGMKYIRTFFHVPVIFSTGSIIKNIKKYGNKVYTITPYAQKRHMLELNWLLQYKIQTYASMSLGRDALDLKYITAEDLNDTVMIANRSKNIDSIYIACTFMPGISGKNIIEKNSIKPVISANGAVLNELLNIIS